MTDVVPWYAVGHLLDVEFGDDVIRYMREIDDTLEPFSGEFMVHGGDFDVREGDCDGALVIIRFPDGTSATRWYESADYQRMLPLRVNDSTSTVALVAGVKPGHTGRAKVAELIAGDGTPRRPWGGVRLTCWSVSTTTCAICFNILFIGHSSTLARYP